MASATATVNSPEIFQCLASASFTVVWARPEMAGTSSARAIVVERLVFMAGGRSFRRLVPKLSHSIRDVDCDWANRPAAKLSAFETLVDEALDQRRESFTRARQDEALAVPIEL